MLDRRIVYEFLGERLDPDDFSDETSETESEAGSAHGSNSGQGSSRSDDE